MALLKAVKLEGRAFLQSVGFDIKQSSYEKAFTLLDDHYGREENTLLSSVNTLIEICSGKII